MIVALFRCHNLFVAFFMPWNVVFGRASFPRINNDDASFGPCSGVKTPSFGLPLVQTTYN
jgi:hypothetical protein